MKNLTLFSVLVMASICVQTTHGMQRAKNLFNSTCTVLSYGIQGASIPVGLSGLATIAKAKYTGNSQEILQLQAQTNTEHPEAVSIVRQELTERGLRKFNNLTHYDDVLVLAKPSLLEKKGTPIEATAQIGVRGAIYFDPIEVQCPNKNILKACTNHEAGHLDGNDNLRSNALAVVLPFVTGFVTSKIKAPIKAFAQAKRLVSDEPSCLKSFAKIPGAGSKCLITASTLAANSRSHERKADAGIPDDMAQLDAWGEYMYIVDQDPNRSIDVGHPAPAERMKTVMSRIAALETAKKSV